MCTDMERCWKFVVRIKPGYESMFNLRLYVFLKKSFNSEMINTKLLAVVKPPQGGVIRGGGDFCCMSGRLVFFSFLFFFLNKPVLSGK